MVISIIFDTITFFLRKALYILVFIVLPFLLLDKPDYSFLWILFFLSLVGALVHNYDLDSSEDKYYALVLMRMDAHKYVMSTSIFYMLTTFIGFFVCLYFITDTFQTLTCALMIIGIKSTILAIKIYLYYHYDIDMIQTICTIIAVMIFIIGFLTFYFDYYLSLSMINYISYIFIVLGILGFIYLYRFDQYLHIFKHIFNNNKDIDTKQINETTYLQRIENTNIQSTKHGFEMMHDLFMQRHHKALWRMTYIKCIVCGIVACASLSIFIFIPDISDIVDEASVDVVNALPFFLFVLYILNNSEDVTRTMFSNCDHSLLNYTFYREPKNLLHLFSIRLKEMIKMNSTYALIIAVTYSVILYLCHYPFYYSVIAFISIMCMCIFFTIHYLTLYYLMQPFNKNKEIVKPAYTIVTTLTYMFCYYMMDLSLPVVTFGITMIAFDVIYCAIACLLVYRFSVKTFRINS
ncbi:MAG: hypothetical protein LUG60_04675 [Erysipelotrichaceae bacterium]|nr:hypothetical protein [Erysipelotrichaceae bacterium]